MSLKQVIVVFLVFMVLQLPLYFSRLGIALVMIPYTRGVTLFLLMPGNLIFSFLSNADPLLMNHYAYLSIFPIIFNAALYSGMIALLAMALKRRQ